MSSYTNIFGGNNINPALLSYAAYAISSNLTLVWAFEAEDGQSVAAAKIDVTASVGSLSVTMPDAQLVSDGQDILVTNRGSNTFTVKDNDGNTLATVTSGTSWYIYLTDNSTNQGTWFSTQLGASTSSANAAALAGAGLVANLTKLDQNLLVDAVAGATVVVAGDLARVKKFTGGTQTWTFTSAVTLANGWFTTIINEGTGTLTLNPTQTIDGAGSKDLLPQESVQVFSDGANFVTFGYGRSVTTGVSAVSIDLTGSGTYTESIAEISSQIQDFSGTLSGNRTVYFGTTPGFWFVYNGTSGAYTTTFAVNGSDSGVTIEQGTYRVIRSNGSNATLSSPNDGYQTFAANGTFTWPVCKGAMAYLMAPGGGGGRGAAGASSGSGGGGGECKRILILPPPAAGTATTVTINAPGAGASANNTSGANGGTVVFGSYGQANGGSGGGVGSGTQGTGGGGTGGVANTSTSGDLGAFTNLAGAGGLSAEYGGGSGASGQAGGGLANGGSSIFGGPGGGGGGGTAPNAGGAGGQGGIRTQGGGAAGGTAGGTAGGAGTAGSAGTFNKAGQGGGGGGGGVDTGGVGGAGGFPSGGGGGGGYGGTTTGNGGTGGAGQVIVTWW